jgi:hypothetical protein
MKNVNKKKPVLTAEKLQTTKGIRIRSSVRAGKKAAPAL